MKRMYSRAADSGLPGADDGYTVPTVILTILAVFYVGSVDDEMSRAAAEAAAAAEGGVSRLGRD